MSRNEIIFKIFFALFILAVALAFFLKPKQIVKKETIIKKITPTPTTIPTEQPAWHPMDAKVNNRLPVDTPAPAQPQTINNNTTVQEAPTAVSQPTPTPIPTQRPLCKLGLPCIQL